MTKIKALVIADDPVFEIWLKDAKDANLEVLPIPGGSAAELIARVEGSGRYDIVFCEFRPENSAERGAFVEQFHERRWQIPIVGLGAEENAECVLSAMRAGARDFFVLHRDDATIGAQVGRLLKRSAATTATAAAPMKAGQMFLALSGHPHESVAFFAEHLALAIVESLPAGDRALLIDLATPSGAAAIFLNLNQTYTVLDAVNDAHRCDQTLIDTAFTRHSSGLYVLSLPEDLLGRAQFDPEQLLKLLTVLRSLFRYTIVAMDGHAPLPALAGVVEMADRSLLLSDQSILKSRHNKYLLRALRQQDASLERMALVVDNYRRRLGLEPRNLAELFELPLVATLQTESYNRIVSMNSGEPLYTLARKDPYCTGMRKLTETLISGELKATVAPQSFLDRLLSKVAMTAADPVERFRLSDQYQQLKSSVHRHLIAQIEERKLDVYSWQGEKVERFVAEQVRRYVLEQRLPINQRESEALIADARNELFGFGPIQSLVDDDSVNDIVVNGPHNVFVERAGKLYSVPVRFNDDNHVLRVIQRILAPLGRRVDESTPMVDARLPDGSRVNAIIPPIALDGPCLSIRKFRKTALTAEDLLKGGSITRPELDYLQQRVERRTNTLVVGGTGSGKTTFLNLLSQWIPAGERIVTVEDAAELRLRHNHVVRLESRPPNLEGQRAVSARDLVRNALRMRPDRIIVGEVRGDEVLDMLQAMNTGHDGSMTTLHANNVRDAMHRMELLAGFAGYNGSPETLRGQIAAAIQLIVHVARLPTGLRRVVSITELRGLDQNGVVMRDVFRYNPDTGQHSDLREAA